MADPNPVHVEMYDGRTFCGAFRHWSDEEVDQRDWHQHAVALNKATCVACLDKIWALGQAAGDRSHQLRRLAEAK